MSLCEDPCEFTNACADTAKCQVKRQARFQLFYLAFETGGRRANRSVRRRPPSKVTLF
jgi:hypothetical protein